MRDLKPIVVALRGDEKYQRLLSNVSDTVGMKSGYVVLKPNESIGEHNTEAKEEAIIILKGKAEVYIAGSPLFCVDENNLIYIPPQTVHDIKNISRGDLRYVYVVSIIKD
jgi:quercetin dioxygenase-like cupin family protein